MTSPVPIHSMEIEPSFTPAVVPEAQLINEFEVGLLDKIGSGELVLVEMPLTHRFLPGMYFREIFMPKGSIVVSRTHLTEHPFWIKEGDVSIYDQSGKMVTRLQAPHVGITPAGTRRVLLMHEDTRWMTAHITDLTDPDAIVEAITEHDNPLLPEGFLDAAFESQPATKELAS